MLFRLHLNTCWSYVFLQAVDYESRSSFSFSVEVLNPTVDPRFLRHGPFKDRALVRVAVLDADEPPRFSRARYHMDVSENCPPECTVGQVSAVDPDTGISNNVRYALSPTVNDLKPHGHYKIVHQGQNFRLKPYKKGGHQPF